MCIKKQIDVKKLYNLFGKGPLKTSHVFMFLLRDSENDYISVDCWGSKVFIQNLMQIVNIQDGASKY